MALDAAYRAFVATEPSATVWHEADLLETLISTDHRLSVDYAAIEAEGKLVGVWPFCRKARLDGWTITMPPLLRYCAPLFDGAWLAEVGLHFALGYAWTVLRHSTSSGQASWRKGYRSFDQNWPQVPSFLPQDKFFPLRVRARITHHIDLATASADLAQLATKQMRYDLRRAARHFTAIITEHLAPDALDLLEAPYQRQGKPVPYAREVIISLSEALRSTGQFCCVRILDSASTLQATGIFLRDAHSAYALLTGVTESARAFSGGSYAMSQGIGWAQTSGVARFDFLGSDTPSIADNFRRLGGVPMAYSHVYQDAASWTRALRAWR